MVPDSQVLLDQLVSLRVLRAEGSEGYAFRHALMHQAVYSTLLRRERRRLHRAVAQTLVGLYGGTHQFTRYLGDLAYHYAQAEDWAEAQQYAQAAGDEALARYAPHEALEHFTRALEATHALAQTGAPELYRQRGRAHETLGDFMAAQADYAAALAAAMRSEQPRAEWQALLDLGLLWSARDYDHAGAYYERALALARQMGDGALLAHSLNRLGNWQLNHGEPRAALVQHREALAIFESLADSAGQAETFDLLGMTSYLSSNLPAGNAYTQQAVGFFRRLDDRTALASALTTQMMRSVNALTDTLPPQAPILVVLAAGDEALELARGNHNRPGEAFALALRSLCLSPLGAYTEALAAGHEGLALAEAIDHQQWQTCALCSLGVAHLDLGNYATAAALLGRAQALAEAIASSYWQAVTAGWLVLAHLGPGPSAAAFERAHALLRPVFDEAHAPHPLGLRVVWSARVELALAEGQAADALGWLDQLLATVPNEPRPQFGDIPRLACLRARALLALGRVAEARTLLEAAEAPARLAGAPLGRARLALGLSQVYARQGQAAAAVEARATAEQVFAELAANLVDPALRATFERTAAGWLAAATG